MEHARVHAERDHVDAALRHPELAADVVPGAPRRGDDGPAPARDLALHPDEGVPAALGELGEPARRLQFDPAVDADRVVDGGHQREPGARQRQHLVVVHQVEVRAPGEQRPPGPQAERERLGKRAGPHPGELEHVDPVPELSRPGPAERIGFPVQVQARQGAQQRPRLEVRVGLAGEHLDVMAERGQFPGQVPQVDALAAAMWLAAVRDQRDPERAIVGVHAGSHLSSAARGSRGRPRGLYRQRTLPSSTTPAPRATRRCTERGHNLGGPGADPQPSPDGEAMPKRALITGITGQDGSYLAEHLLAQGYEVWGLVRGQANPRVGRVRQLLADVRLVRGDLLDQGSLISAVERVQPDEVYNLAAISYVPMSWQQAELTGEVTGLGVLRVLEAIRV